MEVKFTLNNANWEKGFQRLWLVYVFIFISGMLFQLYEVYRFYPDSENWFFPIGTFISESWLYILLWLFVPVLLSKAIQWVLKGFKPDNK
jgi:hypothetical protein